ncbi:conserved hypothetical protein [Verrucomicrobia bacterium]|nr:conserved hypothetical protein [Verrucomicrobiota bacterium]
MNRVLIVVEGPTERAVIERVLAPHFGEHALALHAKVVGKPGHKGGIRNFESVRKEVMALLRQERRSFVSTFFDYCGLPENWPGVNQARGRPAPEKARIVESSMLESLRSVLGESKDVARFVPYVQMHELEALLFSSTNVMASTFERQDLASAFAEIVSQCGGCEEINDKSETAPSRRIASLFPAYRKGSGLTAHAPIIVKRIGLNAIRQACPHFSDWMARLEKL